LAFQRKRDFRPLWTTVGDQHSKYAGPDWWSYNLFHFPYVRFKRTEELFERIICHALDEYKKAEDNKVLQMEMCCAMQSSWKGKDLLSAAVELDAWGTIVVLLLRPDLVSQRARACIRKNWFLKHLLRRDGSVDLNACYPGGGDTILHFLANRDSRNAVHFILAHQYVDPNIHTLCRKVTPLHCAVETGNVDFVRVLLADKRVDPNARDSENRTALHLAVREKKIKVIRVLTEDPRVELEVRDKGGFIGSKPVEAAEANGHHECVRLIRAERARRKQQKNDQRKARKQLSSHGYGGVRVAPAGVMKCQDSRSRIKNGCCCAVM